jgi:hypothetical protein
MNEEKITVDNSSTNYAPFVIGGVVIVGFIAVGFYFWKKDREMLDSMDSKDKAEVMKSRAYSGAIVGAASMLSGTEGKTDFQKSHIIASKLQAKNPNLTRPQAIKKAWKQLGK